MELRHLRYFLAVAEGEHFGRAAKKLNIAQPALTRQIHQLERELGFHVFKRLPRGVCLSENGRFFLQETKRLLAQLNNAVEQGRAMERGELGILRIGFNDSASWDGVMPNAILKYREAFPSVKLDLYPMSSADQVIALRQSDIDAAFAYNTPPDPEINTVVVEQNNVVIAMPRNHRLAKLSRALRLADFQNDRFVSLLTGTPIFNQRVLAACIAGGLTPNVIQEVGTESMVLSLVATGNLVGIVTTTSIKRPPTNVVLRTIANLSVKSNLELAWRADNKSAGLSRFVQIVSEMGNASV